MPLAKLYLSNRVTGNTRPSKISVRFSSGETLSILTTANTQGEKL